METAPRLRDHTDASGWNEFGVATRGWGTPMGSTKAVPNGVPAAMTEAGVVLGTALPADAVQTARGGPRPVDGQDWELRQSVSGDVKRPPEAKSTPFWRMFFRVWRAMIALGASGGSWDGTENRRERA